MKHILLIFGILFTNFSFSQQLTIDETINYINANLDNEFKLKVNKDRNFKIFQDKESNQYWINYNNKLREHFPNSDGNGTNFGQQWSYSGIINNISLVKNVDYNNDFLLEFKCLENSPCFYISGRKIEAKFKNNNLENINSYLISGSDINKSNFELSFKNENKRDKIFNAFKYLIVSIKNSSEYQNQDSDPFANENFSILYSEISGKITKDEIKLIPEGGTYDISVNINGLTKIFVLDSGASEISISNSVEKELISKGLLKREDYLEPGLYRIADGSIVSQRRINLREVKVGGFIVKNVTASVGSGSTPLLLGKTFLDKFSRWLIDNNSQKLILEK